MPHDCVILFSGSVYDLKLLHESSITASYVLPEAEQAQVLSAPDPVNQ